MTAEGRTTQWWVLALVGAAGIIVGSTVVWFWRPSASLPHSMPSAGEASLPIGPAMISLSPEVIARAGIRTGVVQARSAPMPLHAPGRVEPNQYAQTVVVAVTPGRITAWSAELGTTVKAGQVIGQFYAPEVAEQERVLLAMQAEWDAAHARLLRTEQLVALGSVSQQELEVVRAEHVRHETDIEGARAKLRLLGLSANQIAQLTLPTEISAVIDIVTPQTGVVIRRNLNVGQTVEVGAELIAVADLSTVWVIADVFERDAARIDVGAPMRVSSLALGGEWQTRVAYIDPQVAPETRTVRIRGEVANRDRRLRFGTYVDVDVTVAPGAPAITVAKAAVQTIGDRQFVYVADDQMPGRFVEREVRLGATAGDLVQIVDGLTAGESIVVEGAFFLRAERDRLGLAQPPGSPPPPSGGRR